MHTNTHQPPIQRITWVTTQGLKQTEHETTHSNPSRAEFKNEWIYDSTPPSSFIRFEAIAIFAAVLVSTDREGWGVRAIGRVWFPTFYQKYFVYKLFSNSSRPAMGPTPVSYSIDNVVISRRLKRQKREVENWPPSCAEFKKEWMNTFTPPNYLHEKTGTT